MFRLSEITPKCDCGAPFIVCNTLGHRRYRLPAGYYGGLYHRPHYYAAEWNTLECQQCGKRREDFFVMRWASNGDRYLIDGPMPRPDRPRKYPEIYEAIRLLMPA